MGLTEYLPDLNSLPLIMVFPQYYQHQYNLLKSLFYRHYNKHRVYLFLGWQAKCKGNYEGLRRRDQGNWARAMYIVQLRRAGVAAYTYLCLEGAFQRNA